MTLTEFPCHPPGEKWYVGSVLFTIYFLLTCLFFIKPGTNSSLAWTVSDSSHRSHIYSFPSPKPKLLLFRSIHSTGLSKDKVQKTLPLFLPHIKEKSSSLPTLEAVQGTL